MTRRLIALSLAILVAGSLTLATATMAQNAAPSASLQPPPPFTGRNLAALCEAPEQRAAERQGCLRFLQASAQMYELAANERGKELAWFCLPRDGDPAHFRRVFNDWAKENAAQLDQPAIQVVKAAFSDIFSCQE